MTRLFECADWAFPARETKKLPKSTLCVKLSLQILRSTRGFTPNYGFHLTWDGESPGRSGPGDRWGHKRPGLVHIPIHCQHRGNTYWSSIKHALSSWRDASRSKAALFGFAAARPGL